LKYEFWPNLLQKAQQVGLEVFAVSTILRPTQVYFKWYGGFFRRALQCVSYFGVQNENTQQLLLGIGISAQKIEILGDLRFNRVLEAKATAKPNALIAQFAAGAPLLIFGSSWPEEEKILFDLLKGNKDFLAKLNLKVLIAPHDLSKKHLAVLKTTFPKAQFYSQWNEPNSLGSSILILDTIGHLSAAYQYGSVAFIGGGFSGSLHNILEPLAYGLPVLFGPKYEKFPEAQQFIDLGFAQVIADAQGLDQILLSLIENQKDAKAIIEAQVFNLQGKIGSKLVS
jgi:3-deoxy-D-manno-octulosonic-acid transferase